MNRPRLILVRTHEDRGLTVTPGEMVEPFPEYGDGAWVALYGDTSRQTPARHDEIQTRKLLPLSMGDI